MSGFSEYDFVRVVRLAVSGRAYRGTNGASRPPQIGDVGTIVFVYGEHDFAVECVAEGGMTAWLADFHSDELERANC